MNTMSRSLQNRRRVAVGTAALAALMLWPGSGAGPANAQTAGSPTPTPAVAAGTPPPSTADTTSAFTDATAAPTEPATAAISPTATPADLTPTDLTDQVALEEIPATAGGANVVQVRNLTDGRMRFRASAQIKHAAGPVMDAANLALAYASCANCQTYAIALQIVVYDQTARQVAPQNAAVAMNAGCSYCYTVARAVQYAIPVMDPDRVPDRVSQLSQQFNAELRSIAQDTAGLTTEQVDARVDAVIQQFQDLGQYLLDYRQARQA